MTATEPIFDITSEREELDAMTMAALKRRYQEETGRASSTRNRQYLIRRLLWIAQAAVRGGLCDEALALAATLANDASVRASPARARVLGVVAPNADATRGGVWCVRGWTDESDTVTANRNPQMMTRRTPRARCVHAGRQAR